MKLTRRDLLIVAAGAPVALSADTRPSPTPNLAPPAVPGPPESKPMLASDVPDALTLARWEHSYRARYAREHAAVPYLRHLSPPGGTEEVREDLYDATTMQGAIDTLARLEAEVPPDPSYQHAAIAAARGEGFTARREDKPATANPFWMALWDPARQHEHDRFMAWHAGWVQADPQRVVARSLGYTPPPTPRCCVCDQPIGDFHGSECMEDRKRRYRVRLGDTPRFRRPIATIRRYS